VYKALASISSTAHTYILATQEAEIRRIAVQSQPRQTVTQDPISRKLNTKKGLVELLKVEALSSSPRTEEKKKKLKVYFLSQHSPPPTSKDSGCQVIIRLLINKVSFPSKFKR
jgi:hypothetical protein